MQELKHWSVSIDDANLCWLTLDVSGKSVHVLTHAVMAELGQIIDWVESQSIIAGVGMLSGKPGGFVYGADIAEFELLATADDVLQHMQMVHGLFNRIDSLDVPTIVGIDGIAVGGGLEISLAFDRLFVTASPKTKLGFPEINLGIMPGYGGTGRAYGRIGTKAVLDMIAEQVITALFAPQHDAHILQHIEIQIASPDKGLDRFQEGFALIPVAGNHL